MHASASPRQRLMSIPANEGTLIPQVAHVGSSLRRSSRTVAPMPSVPPVADRPAALPGDAEWLLADGAGGYGCGSVDDLARRRYHGLWVARLPGAAKRWMVVAALDERFVAGTAITYLMHAHWRGHERPSPSGAQVAFTRRPLPSWRLQNGAQAIERTFALQRVGADRAACLLVRYRNLGATPLRLEVRPLLGWCDVDHLLQMDSAFDATVHARGASWGVRPNSLLPMLWVTADGVAAFRSEAAWYRGCHFAIDQQRGYDHVGDRWTPGAIELDLGSGQEATLAFALGEPQGAPTAAFDAVMADAAGAWRTVAPQPAALAARLAPGADDFLYRADGGRLGVLAGFPWFGEWGRDVFLSLPGLTLARGRLDLCLDALRGALPFLRDGLLPNIYGATVADSHYGSCDAALWFTLAVQRFADAGGDATVVRGELVPALVSIAEAYERGTGLGLCATADGLLAAGRKDLNATWMDARTAAGPVTPREGLPVEIQALWYALLAFLAEHAGKRWAALRDRCGKAFEAQFWLPASDERGSWLADRVHDGIADRSVRPNMLVAAALARSPLTVAQRAACVEVARRELVTPRGLRTLSPREPGYRGRYEGGGEARDGAYHQGTVWPWLAGFYVEAALAAASKKARPAEAKALQAWLHGFLPELDRAGLDHVSEVFDGDEPQRPGGTFAQAWNTGELLRALQLCAETAK